MKLIVDSFEYREFNGDVQFFYFPLELLFGGKFDSKTKYCQFKLKFNT